MARLIDADALKEKICNNVYPITDFFNSQDYGMFWTGGIEKAIDEAPTIDAEPTRHGKWKEYQRLEANIVGELQSAECSVCGRYHTTPYMHSYDYYEYCPWCGARMEAEE